MDQCYSCCEEMIDITKNTVVDNEILLEEHACERKYRRQKGIRKFLQKYYHKGAFYMDSTSLSKDAHDVRKKKYDEVTGEDNFNFKLLPKVLQVKNFGKRGRSKYTHLLDQDTTIKDGYMHKFDSTCF